MKKEDNGLAEDTPVVPEPEKRPYREVLTERFREENPEDDQDYTDDEVFFGALERYDNGRNDLLRNYEDNSRKLSALFNENPQAGVFLTSLMNGSEVLDALGESFGSDIEAAMRDPEGRKQYDAGVEKWKKNKADTDAIIRQQEENAVKYADEVEQFFAENRIGDEEKEAFSSFVSNFIDKLVRFELSREVLTQLLRAYRYDSDIATASEQGEIRGRNENIYLERGRADETDGLPMTNTTGRDNPSPYDYSERISIWDR